MGGRTLLLVDVVKNGVQPRSLELPLEAAISAITLAELTVGPHATSNSAERARRQDRLQRTEATFNPIPFGHDCARAYGRVYAAMVERGRKARCPRVADLMIAATALAEDIPVYTRNADDLLGLEALITVVPI